MHNTTTNTTNETVTAKSSPKKSKLKKGRMIIRGLVGVLIAGALISISMVGCKGHGKHMDKKVAKRMMLSMLDDVMDDIDATKSQRELFETTAIEILNEGFAMKKNHHGDHQLLLKELSKAKPNRDVLNAHVDEKFSRMEEFVTKSMNKAMDAYETLDATQKAIVLEKLENHMENH